MKVTLINYTKDAVETLLFTKSTRLNMSPDLMFDIHEMSEEKKMEELQYMSRTIPSSWEFVDYTFLIQDVTRAFTHQLVRNRHGSYAQQTMRILNVDGFGFEVGPTIKNDKHLDFIYKEEMNDIQDTYNCLIENGASIEDARGVLPTNIHTNIVAKFNLRTMAEIVSKRSSPRTQGEYRDVLEGMYQAIIEVHPWAEMFLKDRKVEAAAKLDAFIKSHSDGAHALDVLKNVDILRG